MILSLLLLAAQPTQPKLVLSTVTLTRGAPPAVGAAFEQAMEAELKAVAGFDFVPARALVARLEFERQSQLLGRSAVQQGALGGAGVGTIVLCDVADAGPKFTVTVRRLDGQTGLELGKQVKSAPAAELSATAHRIVEALFGKTAAKPAPAPAGPKKVTAMRVAVLEVRTVGELPPRALAALDHALTPELRKLEGVSAVSSVEIRDMLSVERQKQLLACDDSDCLTEIAGALDADELVSIDLALVGESYSMAARRTDLRASKVVQTELKKFERRDGEELLSVVGPTIAALYPERALKAGKTRGVEASIVRRVNPPPLARWVFGTTLGLSAAIGAVGGAFGLLMKDSETQHAALLDRSVSGMPVDTRDVTALEARAYNQARVANALFVTAGVVLLVAAIEALFTDWRDDRAAALW